MANLVQTNPTSAFELLPVLHTDGDGVAMNRRDVGRVAAVIEVAIVAAIAVAIVVVILSRIAWLVLSSCIVLERRQAREAVRNRPARLTRSRNGRAQRRSVAPERALGSSQQQCDCSPMSSDVEPPPESA